MRVCTDFVGHDQLAWRELAVGVGEAPPLGGPADTAVHPTPISFGEQRHLQRPGWSWSIFSQDRSTPPSPESTQSEVFSQALPAQGRVSSGWRKEEGPKAGPQRPPPPHNGAASGAVALCSFCECLKPQSVLSSVFSAPPPWWVMSAIKIFQACPCRAHQPFARCSGHSCWVLGFETKVRCVRKAWQNLGRMSARTPSLFSDVLLLPVGRGAPAAVDASFLETRAPQERVSGVIM